MSISIIKQMFEANIHFGHQTSKWNPKMKKYIYISKNGLHIIDLRKTIIMMKKAIKFITEVTSKGQKILFVGTKRQARTIILKHCSKTKSFFVYNRWLGGTLTNFVTIKNSIQRMKNLDFSFKNGSIERFPKKEIFFLNKNLEKLKKNFWGLKDMHSLPNAIFIVDPIYEKNAINEANNLNIPIIAIADTNCNPEVLDYPIPSNDDSFKSIDFFINKAAEACLYGEKLFTDTNKRK